MARSEAERREYQRKWAAERRAGVRAERDASRQAARVDAVTNAPRTARDALEASIAAARWLKDSDGAAVNLARILAREFDYADHMADDALALRVAGQLTGLLDRLGLTPVVRMKFELRSAQLQTQTVGDVIESAAAPLPANVSELPQRPAKKP